MNIVDRARLSLSATFLGSHAREAIDRMQKVEARAHQLLIARAVLPEMAWRVAAFTMGTWAQRYPVRGCDLGEACALFVLDWLTARHVDTTDAMHEALQEWRAGETLGWFAELCPLDANEVKAAPKNATPRAAAHAARAPNRHERRRALSRRWGR